MVDKLPKIALRIISQKIKGLEKFLGIINQKEKQKDLQSFANQLWQYNAFLGDYVWEPNKNRLLRVEKSKADKYDYFEAHIVFPTSLKQFEEFSHKYGALVEFGDSVFGRVVGKILKKRKNLYVLEGVKLGLQEVTIKGETKNIEGIYTFYPTKVKAKNGNKGGLFIWNH